MNLSFVPIPREGPVSLGSLALLALDRSDLCRPLADLLPVLEKRLTSDPPWSRMDPEMAVSGLQGKIRLDLCAGLGFPVAEAEAVLSFHLAELRTHEERVEALLTLNAFLILLLEA